MSHRATVHQLESDFADAMNRMYAVGNGLARLRAELDRESVLAATAPATPTRAPGAGTPGAGHRPGAGPAVVPVPREVPPPLQPTAPPATPPTPQTPRQAWYRREGAVTKVLAVTGAVVTLAGVAMLLVLAVQQGWFGPGARVTAGAMLAAVLVGLGVRGGEVDRRVHGAVGSAPIALVATGAAAAYLDVVAVTSGYGWVPPAVGLLIAGCVAIGGLHLARRWDSELLAVLMVLGAAGLAPVVAQGVTWVVSAFLGILCLVGWWAGGARTRTVLTVARVVPVTLSLLVAGIGAEAAEQVGYVAVAAALLLSTLATSTTSVRRNRDDASASAAVALLSVGLLATTAPLADPARTVVLALAAAVLLVATTTLGRPPVGPVAGHFVGTVGISGTTLAVLAVISGAPDRFVTTGLLLLALAAFTAAAVSRTHLALGLATGVAAVAVLGWLQHPLAALTASTAADHDMVVALVDSVLLAAVVAMGLWATAHQRGLGREVRLTATILAWVLGLTASATASVAVGTLLGAEVGRAALGFTVGHAVATVTWMVAGAWLLLRGLGRTRDADLTLRTGLLLTAVSVAKLFLFDLAALSGLVRSVAFIVTGLLLLATGSRYARAHERARRTA